MLILPRGRRTQRGFAPPLSWEVIASGGRKSQAPDLWKDLQFLTTQAVHDFSLARRSITNNGVDFAVGRYGREFNSGQGGQATLAINDTIPIPTEWTFVCLSNFGVSRNTFATALFDDPNFKVCLISSGGNFGVWGSSFDQCFAGSDVSGWHVVATRQTSASGGDGWVDGVQKQTHAQDLSGNNLTHALGDIANQRNWYPTVWLGFWSRALSEPELKELADQPFGFLTPRPTLVPVSAGGGGLSLAVAAPWAIQTQDALAAGWGIQAQLAVAGPWAVQNQEAVAAPWAIQNELSFTTSWAIQTQLAVSGGWAIQNEFSFQTGWEIDSSTLQLIVATNWAIQTQLAFNSAWAIQDQLTLAGGWAIQNRAEVAAGWAIQTQDQLLVDWAIQAELPIAAPWAVQAQEQIAFPWAVQNQLAFATSWQINVKQLVFATGWAIQNTLTFSTGWFIGDIWAPENPASATWNPESAASDPGWTGE